MIRDLGPTEEDLTTAQRLLVDRAVGMTGVIRLIEEYCREQGIFEGKALAPVLSANYGVFTNNLRMILLALGVNTRASERILGPLELAEQIDKEEAEKEARTAGERAEVPQDRLSSEDSAKTTDNLEGVPGEEIDDKGGEDDG
ncbi:MAG: hypothetical protein MUQ00_11500 [Candidatus Aminicenantes bacterium]|nr:hypothetical protein [Candidatus Aminicenantes bacterium]